MITCGFAYRQDLLSTIHLHIAFLCFNVYEVCELRASPAVFPKANPKRRQIERLEERKNIRRAPNIFGGRFGDAAGDALNIPTNLLLI
jgi:hypothetical protein